MKKTLILLLSVFLFAAWFPHGISNLPNTPLTVLNLGGGGNISGQSLPPTGIRLARGDAFGAYIFGTDNTWHLINGENNLCPGYTTTPCPYFGYYPANTSDNQLAVSFTGITELVGCPSSASCAYMWGGGWVFYSGNISASNPGAITWCHTNFTQTADSSASAIGFTVPDPGPLMAVDPNNPDHVIVGTQGGGATFTGAISGTALTVSGTVGTIAIGSAVVGPGVAAGTVIVSGSGTSWVVNNSQTVGSEAMTSGIGLFESFNATSACSGTDTWTAIPISSIPQGSGYGDYIVAFDPTSATMTCHNGSGTCTSVAYVSTNGTTAGVYATTNAGTSWALTTSGPSVVIHMKVSAATAGAGNVWVTDGSHDVWEYVPGTGWNQNTSGGVAGTAKDITINPFAGDDIAVASTSGKVFVSTNGSSGTPTFTAFTGTSSTVSGDSPWAAKTQIAFSTATMNGMDFDPVNNGTLLGHGSQWEWVASFPSANFTWATLSSGIQGAVSLGNIQVSAARTPTFGYEDISGCTYSIAAASTPASQCALPMQGNFGLYYYSGLSIAPGTTFMASNGDDDFASTFSLAGYSTDGFKTTYLPYNTWNASVAASSANVTSGTASAVRLNVGSTALLNSFTPGNTLSNNSIVCIVTQFFSSALSQNCWPINVIDASHIDLIGSTVNLSTMVNAAQTYIVYVPANVLDDWLGKGTVRNVTSATGVVSVTYTNSANTTNRTVVCISGVVMTGATVVNGCWVPVSGSGGAKFTGAISGTALTVSVVTSGTISIGGDVSGAGVTQGTYIVSGSGTSWVVSNSQTVGSEAMATSGAVQLKGSTFVGGDSYSTGGVVVSSMAPGGGIAASTPSNFAMYGGDNTFAFCTANAGATWSQVSVAGVPKPLTTVTGGPYTAGTTSITIAAGVPGGSVPVLLLSSGRYLNETGSTIVGTTITLAIPIPPGDSLPNNTFYSTTTGGPFAAFFRSHQMAADQVTPNTFYYMNSVAGLVKWTNCGSTTIVTSPSTFLTDAGNNDQLKAVPGQAGHLFYTAGPVGSAGSPHPAVLSLWRTCNGINSTANSVTLSAVPGFFEVHAVGFGAIAPGETYPSIYVVGWYSPTNSINNATYGIWLSKDDANNGATGTCAIGNTWTEISGTGGLPAGFPGHAWDIEGDPFIFGPYYVLGSFGQFYGVQN